MATLKWLAGLLAAPAVFLLLALAATWPLAASPASGLPMGTERAATVPLFNVWTVWWNANRAAAGYAGYWDAPIFHPQAGAFSFSEPMPLSIVAAPVIWITGSRVLAYNLLLILYLWLNGGVAYYLLRRFHFYRPIPWIGGAMVVLLPLVHSWLGVLQLVPVFGILWTVAAVHRFSLRPTPMAGLAIGGAWALTYLMCAYYGLFITIPLVLSAGWLMGRRMRRGRVWAAMLPGILAGALICLPFAAAQRSPTGCERPAHTARYLSQLSAMPPDYLVPPCSRGLGKPPRAESTVDDGFGLYPGNLKVTLALAGLLLGLAAPRRRHLTLFCFTMLCTAFALSLGPLLQIAGWQPYLFLVDHLPGFGQARNVFRFAVVVHLMVVLLAMMGLHGATAITRRHMGKGGPRRLVIALIMSVGMLAVVEIVPPAQALYPTPDNPSHRRWADWLATCTPVDSVIACVPFPFRPDVVGYEQETRWMYWQTFHGRKMVNGYSGYFPESFLHMKMAMAAFPAPETMRLLQRLKVTYCVVKRDSIFAQAAWNEAAHGSCLVPVFHDNKAWIDIYRLLPGAGP